MVPTVHMNLPFLCRQGQKFSDQTVWWFGGGLDLHLIIFLKRTLAIFTKSAKNRLIYSQVAIIQNLRERAMVFLLAAQG